MPLGNGVFGAYRHMFEIDISFLIVLETVADDPSGCLLKFACSTGLAGLNGKIFRRPGRDEFLSAAFLIESLSSFSGTGNSGGVVSLLVSKKWQFTAGRYLKRSLGCP